MATNPGVIVLTKTQLRDTQLHHRLDIEDNIGEEMHIHYKNFRMDYTVRDFLELARACDSALTNLQKYEYTCSLCNKCTFFIYKLIEFFYLIS